MNVVRGWCALFLLLNGCASFAPKPLPTTEQRWEHSAPGCSGEQCPLLNVQQQHLKDLPALNARIDQQMLALTTELSGDPPPASLAVYERDFFASAKPGWVSYLQSKVLEQHDDLLIIELSSYRATGSRGVPGRSYLLYDRAQNRVLALNDLLLPGMDVEFWQQAKSAHQAWLIKNGLDKEADYLATWPFERTANVVPLKKGVLLKYGVGRIAPYEKGHPELWIPYSRLANILKPQYMPKR